MRVRVCESAHFKSTNRCACHEICTSRLTKRCACHEIYTWRLTKRCALPRNLHCATKSATNSALRGSQSAVPATKFALRAPQCTAFATTSALRGPQSTAPATKSALQHSPSAAPATISENEPNVAKSRSIAPVTKLERVQITTISKVLPFGPPKHDGSLAPATKSDHRVRKCAGRHNEERSRGKHPPQPTRFCEPAQSKCTSKISRG